MAWTNEQHSAIVTRGSNIMVSAGAGSGKTAVLSERVLDYCMHGGDVRRVLVLTFTNAAAKEMKERIRTKLIANSLLDQADYIDASYITTFDAYSLALVKKYAYKLNLSFNLGIMDGVLISLKRKEIVDNLFSELYEREDPKFLAYLLKYAKQDDKAVSDTIIKLCDKLSLVIDFSEFKNSYEDKYFNENKINQIISEYETYCKEEVDDFFKELELLLDASALDEASVKLYDGLSEILNKISSLKGYEEYYQFFNNLSFPRLSPKASADVKELKEKCTESLKLLKTKLFSKYIFTSDMANEILSTKDDSLFLLDLCDEVEKRLMEYKKSVMQFDYMDIAKFALELVKKYDDVYNEIKTSYDEILVDEYQDTSDIQEAFLKTISNNNLYMVGDIKQSIYRFRNANPYIFKEKYNKYSLGIDGIKIDLLANFRSRCEVLANINQVFNRLMTDSCGDADYITSHQMNYGQKNYENEKQNIDFNLDILTYDKEEYSDLSQSEQEAFIVCNEVKKIMYSNAKVLGKNGFRDVEYSDFAILIDNAKSFVTFKRVFEYLGVPMSIEADLDLKDSILPHLFSNIVLIINKLRNKEYDIKYKHALASIARSFIYQYNDEDVFLLIKGTKYPILDDFYYLAGLDSLTYRQLFFEIVNKLNIYEKLAYIGGVDESVVVLENIYKMFINFENTSFDLGEVAEFLSEAFSSDMKMSYKLSSTNSSSVRIMTIHKSKGLEFPYCFFPMLTNRFNTVDAKAQIGYHPNYGIYVPFSDEGKSRTIISRLIENDITKSDISEKVRLLYVAMTRAREKMIMIAPFVDKVRDNPKRFTSFYEMLEYSGIINTFSREIDIKDYAPTSDYLMIKDGNLNLGGQNKIQYFPLDSPKVIEKSRISKELHSLPSKELKNSLKLGLEFHSALESLDLANPDIESLPTSDFVKNNLKIILNNEIFKNIKNGKSYHEHEFYFTNETESYHGIIDLFVVYDDYIDIIDYKLSNTDSIEYVRQLSIYKEYIKSKWDKKINVYLLSLLKSEIKKLEI